jgi:nucleotide-binding universal stress UspA family protein
MYRHIVSAYDGNHNSDLALEEAVALAALCKAKLDILIVEEIYPHSGTVFEVRREKAVADRKSEKLKRKIAEAAAPHGIDYNPHVFAGPPVAFITEFVHESKADLLVIGASEHVSMIELIIGRRSDRIAHYAGCSVLIAR